MSQIQTTKCDGCGRIQGEANHWQQLRVGPGIIVHNEDYGFVYNSNAAIVRLEAIDFCGQGCAMKYIAELLGWNIKPEA